LPTEVLFCNQKKPVQSKQNITILSYFADFEQVSIPSRQNLFKVRNMTENRSTYFADFEQVFAG